MKVPVIIVANVFVIEAATPPRSRSLTHKSPL